MNTYLRNESVLSEFVGIEITTSAFQNDEGTDSTKINHPGHNIRMYWTNFWQSTAYVQQNIFEKTLVEVGGPHLYASFGTFCIQIGQLFATQ